MTAPCLLATVIACIALAVVVAVALTRLGDSIRPR